jgi:hypothetical protein
VRKVPVGAVEIIGLLERYDPYDRVSFDKAKCRVCGGQVLDVTLFDRKLRRH